MRIKAWLITVLIFLSTSVLTAETSSSLLSFTLTPGVNIPLGGDADYYNIGGGGGLSAEYRLAAAPILFINTGVGYQIAPVVFDTSLSLISAGAGAGLIFDLGPKLYIRGMGTGGYYYSFLNDSTGPKSGNPCMYGGADIHYMLTQSISLGLHAGYVNYFGTYNGVLVGLGTSLHIGAEQRDTTMEEEGKRPGLLKERVSDQLLEIQDIAFDDVFPVFFKYYDENPVGNALLKNNSDQTISDISVTLFVKQYMDSPKLCKSPEQLNPGEESVIELYSLFTEEVLEITESTKASAEISLEFNYGGDRYGDTYVETIRLYDRNATTWDDDRKAAAFVTAKDPAVLTFSKNIAVITKGKGSRAVNENLRMAMGLHEALSLFGMAYVVDPKTPYKEMSVRKSDIDFLQFPRQTFQYRAGDCDDLSILYCSLLESVGIDTAFITVPGHILIAFSINQPPDRARRSFLRAEDLIFRDEETWIPVEVTKIDSGFLSAWQAGAKQWREHVAREQENFYPMQESWKLYEPVGLPGSGPEISLPPSERILRRYLEELVTFIDREIYPKLAELQAEVQRTGGSPKAINDVGVLYARYGLDEKAIREFEKALEEDDIFIPALINIGNIHFLRGDMGNALSYYKRAYELNPEIPTVLLCMARVNHAMENYGIVNETYGKLKIISPDLAQRFAYLDLRGEEAEQAKAIGGIEEVVLWEE